MARIYSRKRGRHGSKKPPVKIVPKWVKYTKEDLESLVVELASEKHTSAEIGKVLRDQYGVPTPRLVLERGVADLMREKNIYPNIPEDLMKLFSSAVKFRDHVARNKKDRSAVKGLEHLESKIRRLIYYYTNEGRLPKDFKYDPQKVKLLVQK